ncbi:mannosylglucosyl-3-phosphoglycerate phosphatase-like isoform X1 [Tachyglossus aculeatus]|uniref:mannosylglucosyl-3-phosphoglycerate phosphatase-like isoform X1 n=1 Tax=Tachyglossus aculeatus TaxID=9261 RepID=UPI0018F48697|nr:mannosylglucosyl-3-phosphoglycerate phosphatase-like isoform X1 [Tachyglossus aculeatus]
MEVDPQPNPTTPGPDDLVVLHFNDVYEVESRSEEPVGGAARFATAVKKFTFLNPLLIFSGDCLNPSVLSSITKGKHMIPILNALGVHSAVFGNHEFDFGVDTLEEYIQQMQFPWFLSNVYDKFTSAPLGHGLVKKIIKWNNMKIGLIGLVEEDWLDTLATVSKSNLRYQDYVEVANQLCKELKAEGADLVVAITHMKWANDARLAQKAQGVNLILGGHDHDYGIKKVNDTWIVKSGSDFRNLTKISIRRLDGSFQYAFEKTEILNYLEEDPCIKTIVQDYSQNLQHLLEEVLCPIDKELDGRVVTVRRSESNLGNLITNAMLEATRADIALLNSGGTLRSDRIHPAGDFTMHDLLAILPIVDPVLVVRATGAQLLDALENGVYKYPDLDGRFPQVAGIEFGFDPNAEPGHRVIRDTVKIQGQYLRKNKVYLLAIKEYIANGKDGYTMLKSCPRLFDSESAQTLSTVVMNHFESIKIVQGKKQCLSGHRMSLITMSKSASLTAFEERTDESTSVIAVPGIEGRICHISQEMKEHLRQLRAARKQGLRKFPTIQACENSDSD